MNKLLAKIDQLIERIPIHLRDLAKKAFFLLVGLAILIAIIIGIRKGIDNATPGGAKIFQKNEDFFYIDKMKEANKKRNKLIEDIEIYNQLFESDDERIHPSFRSLGKDTDDRLIGEKEQFLKKADPLRQKKRNLLIDDDSEMHYNAPLPDNLKKSSPKDETPFIEGENFQDKKSRNQDQVPKENIQENQYENPEGNTINKSMDFIE